LQRLINCNAKFYLMINIVGNQSDGINLKHAFSLFFLMFLLCLSNSSSAQTSDELSRVRVEELTDEQISRFVLDASRMGIKDEEIEIQALQRGMNPDEIVKLRSRLSAARKLVNNANPQLLNPKPNSSKNKIQDSITAIEKSPLLDYIAIFSALRSKNFGAEVFANPKSTFEPNLQLPTPQNYILAAGDELLIDVSGYSEASYRVKVSPEGFIRIPLVGPIPVNGLSIEQAKKNIISKLANTVYTNIKSGKTKVDINLVGIRSIKVTIIGEAIFPGTYTLPSVASVYNALYACSGLNANGCFRNIEVVRNNITVVKIDVYDYLINGSKKNDITLKDNDVIKINTYNVRVELKGEVKKPGIYDVANNETIEKIISYAGGFNEYAYRNKIQVYSNSETDRQISTLKEEQIKTAIPKAGDTYIIGKILNRFTNRIGIKGSVYRPGEYELKNGMTLLLLIEEADGLREDAFLNRGIIHRLKDDLSPEVIAFDLEKLKKGEVKDIELKKEDRITIYSKFDLKEGYYVTIDGEVSSPGIFLYEQGLTIQDLILMAGGLKESASLKRIEVSRRIKGEDAANAVNTKAAIIFQKDINFNLKDSLYTDTLALSPFDEVTIYTSLGYAVQKNVIIEGEVKFAGKYTLEGKTDRISDLVKRAGGITAEAYLSGAVLTRTKKYSKSEQNNTEQGLNNLLKQNYSAGAPAPFLQLTYNELLQKKSENVGINLKRILENPASKYDLLLNDGDTLRIPKELQTVRVNGEVLYPALVRYNKGNKFKDYISGAGGFSEKSARKKSYVVNANGSAKGTKSFFFIKNYPKVYPGSEIFVPVKRERARVSVLEGITIGTTLVTLSAILLNLLKK
jgi:protein involved in polysaccharide export with SLBB domain